MPIFTELNAETALAYAHALADVFGLTVADETPEISEGIIADGMYEYLLSDGSTAAVWFEFDRVYGEA